MTITYNVRDPTDDDFQFLYSLKKAAEYDAIKKVFGWDETLQVKMHLDEWNEARPNIIEINGLRAGSFLFEERDGHYYLGRFFLLPEFHSKGLGSNILRKCILKSNKKQIPIKLQYLQDNHVASLYVRYGFEKINEDKHFVYMLREPDVV